MISELETEMNKAREAIEPGAIEKFVERMADKVGGNAGVKAVFGDPIERDGITVIPVARVRWGFGGGAGMGPAAMGKVTDKASKATDKGSKVTDKETESAGEGDAAVAGGSGAGGGVMADPVGYLEIGPAGVHFRALQPPMPSPGFIIAAGATTAMVVTSLARLRGR